MLDPTVKPRCPTPTSAMKAKEKSLRPTGTRSGTCHLYSTSLLSNRRPWHTSQYYLQKVSFSTGGEMGPPLQQHSLLAVPCYSPQSCPLEEPGPVGAMPSGLQCQWTLSSRSPISLLFCKHALYRVHDVDNLTNIYVFFI